MGSAAGTAHGWRHFNTHIRVDNATATLKRPHEVCAQNGLAARSAKIEINTLFGIAFVAGFTHLYLAIAAGGWGISWAAVIAAHHHVVRTCVSLVRGARNGHGTQLLRLGTGKQENYKTQRPNSTPGVRHRISPSC